ncbi:ras GTPase-activating protein-binding protein 2-like [Gouania willdenowi]|uniref:ras GTPase-activating protein-binding protein 2-like n=1 Tax=Gouania willdenowi TaxID=441366 RepID=UPI001056CC6B|nr:ras GTPase-activating protein-binding protein 2-like [Gouania willdenowi]
MEMEKSSPLFVAQEFVGQHYRLLNKAPDVLHGSNSSYVHGGLDTNGNLAEPVYGQAGIHEKIESLQISECHTKIRHVDAHAMLNNGVVVQVLGELSNSGQPMRKFVQTFDLAPEGSDAKKHNIHNNIFSYVDEVFGDSDAELDEESKKDVEPEPKTQQTPKPRVGSKSKTQMAPQPPRAQHTRDRRSFPPQRPRTGGRDGGPGDMDNRRIVRYPDSHQLFVGNLPHDTDESELKELFMTYGNEVELRINTRGVSRKLPKFGFVVFDNSDPVQNILQDEPIWYRGEVRLNVEKKKAWPVRERERCEMRCNNRGPPPSARPAVKEKVASRPSTTKKRIAKRVDEV